MRIAYIVFDVEIRFFPATDKEKSMTFGYLCGFDCAGIDVDEPAGSMSQGLGFMILKDEDLIGNSCKKCQIILHNLKLA